MNLKLIYLYRDGANYKNWHEEVFSNVGNVSLETINARLREKLIDGTWFYVDKWNLKDLHFDRWDNEIDHLWHEFDNLEETDELATRGDISQFILRIE
jgi:hypothetical protein